MYEENGVTCWSMTGPRLRVEDLLAVEGLARHFDECKLQLDSSKVEIVYLVTSRLAVVVVC